MKKLAVFFIITVTACGCSTKQHHEIITVDVTQNYPKKNIYLQDIAEVDYIPLETKDGYLLDESWKVEILGVDKNGNFIICNKEQGDIMFFDSQGKAVKKFNKKGKSGQEYSDISQVAYERDADEIFVHPNGGGYVRVYNTNGVFIRNIELSPSSSFSLMLPTNHGGIIYYDVLGEIKPPLIIRSSQDSTIIKKVEVPYKERIFSYMYEITSDQKTRFIHIEIKGKGDDIPAIPYRDRFIINEVSCDTIYEMDYNGNLTPFIVRTPSLEGMDPVICLWVDFRTDNYVFMTSRKKVWEDMTAKGIIYDIKKGILYEGSVENKELDSSISIRRGKLATQNNITVFYDQIPALSIVSMLEKDKLEGKLKQMAEKINEEDNPVLAIYRFNK